MHWSCVLARESLGILSGSLTACARQHVHHHHHTVPHKKNPDRVPRSQPQPSRTALCTMFSLKTRLCCTGLAPYAICSGCSARRCSCCARVLRTGTCRGRRACVAQFGSEVCASHLLAQFAFVDTPRARAFRTTHAFALHTHSIESSSRAVLAVSVHMCVCAVCI